VFDRFLRQMRELVRTGAYVMTDHAHEEMEADGLTLFDVERGILTGAIRERQRDRRTSEWKYLIVGRTLSADEVVAVCKIGPTGKLVFITVYRHAE
jgi:hypothetical protein